jgi:hypothetical protein
MFQSNMTRHTLQLLKLHDKFPRMKTLIMAGIFLISLSTFAGSIKYPYVAESIRCLVLNSNTNQTVANKFIEIEKIYSDAKNFEYTATTGIHAETDYGTQVTLDTHGKFHQKTDLFKLSIQITPESLDHFLTPKNMEPFFVNYIYDNTFFDQHDKLRAKCLHRIY